MQRGVQNFSPEQQQLIHSSLSQMETTQPNLLQKMAPHPETVQVELSEDETEQILDSLPAPTPDAAPLAKQTRQQVQQFLTKLRN